MDIEAFARGLEYYRRRQRLSKKELANMAGIDASLIVRYEKGMVANPGLDGIKRLAEALGVSVDALLAGPPSPDTDLMSRVIVSNSTIDLQMLWNTIDDRINRAIETKLGRNSNEPLTLFLPAPNQAADSLSSDQNEGPHLLPGHEYAGVYDLRASADASRYLLHDGAEERPIGKAMFDASLRWSDTSRVVAFKVDGACLAPVIEDGSIIFVEIERVGFPLGNLHRAVDSIVFASVGEAFHVKILRHHAGQWSLASLNGDPPIPIDDDVRLIGIVIQQTPRSNPRPRVPLP